MKTIDFGKIKPLGNVSQLTFCKKSKPRDGGHAKGVKGGGGGLSTTDGIGLGG